MSAEWIGCRFNIGVEEFDYVEATLKKYTKGNYIIAHETAKNPHYHILFEGTDIIYKNFSQTLKRKFQLNMNGKKTEYRRDKEIRTLEQYQTYILKDGNYRSNMDADKIKELYSNSYQKENVNPINEEIIKELIEELKHKKLPNYTMDWNNQWKDPREDIFAYQANTKIYICKKLLKKKAKKNKCRVNRIYDMFITEAYEQDLQHYDHISSEELIYFNLFKNI